MIYTIKRWVESTEEGAANFYKSIFSLLRVVVLSRPGHKLPVADSESCYILGNGPSLKKVLLEKGEKLKEQTLICVNNFPSTPQYLEFKPRHVILLDQAFYEKNPVKRLDVVKKTLEALVKDTTWPVTLYFPMLAKGSGIKDELTSVNSNLRVVYYNYTIAEGYDWLTFGLFKIGMAMPRCQNVLGASVFLAINAGYKEVVVLGADHSWPADVFVDEDNSLCVRTNHFYNQGQPVQIYKMPANNATGKKITISQYFMDCSKAFDVYYVLERYAKKKGTHIWNATEGSYIDAFDRKKV